MFILNPYTKLGVPFIIEVNTALSGTSASNQFIIPVDVLSGFRYKIKTSDGQSIKNISGNYTVNFPTSGVYTIEIYEQTRNAGGFKINFNNGGDCLKLTKILQFGDINWRGFSNSFYGCSNLSMSYVVDAPKITSAIFLSTFRGCSSITNFAYLSSWDVSSVTNMSNMFTSCSSFNQDLSSWDVSSVTNMSNMFRNCSSFNQDLGNWDVSSVTIMNGMFWEAYSFNQDISGWSFNKNATFANPSFNPAFLLIPSYPINYYGNLIIRINEKCGAGSGRTNPEKNFGVGALKYPSFAATARQALIDDGWDIRDGGAE